MAAVSLMRTNQLQIDVPPGRDRRQCPLTCDVATNLYSLPRVGKHHCSPPRAQVDTHLVLRDLSGKLLHEYRHLDNGFGVEAGLLWPAGAPGPIVHVKKERLAFGPDLRLLEREPLRDVLFNLGDERYLVRQDRLLV